MVLVLDGDDAGQRRSNDVLDLFVAADLDLRILTLPSGMDPCDYVLTNGVDSFQALVNSARDALSAASALGVTMVKSTRSSARWIWSHAPCST